jgi:hypothetical protein
VTRGHCSRALPDVRAAVRQPGVIKEEGWSGVPLPRLLARSCWLRLQGRAESESAFAKRLSKLESSSGKQRPGDGQLEAGWQAMLRASEVTAPLPPSSSTPPAVAPV